MKTNGAAKGANAVAAGGKRTRRATTSPRPAASAKSTRTAKIAALDVAETTSRSATKASGSAAVSTKEPSAKEPSAKDRAAARRAEAALVASALRTLKLEADGISELRTAIGGDLAGAFASAVTLIKNARGRVIVTGIGKSGHVGQKIAATFASTGTPAFCVHPSEASHGDLGMITPEDVILALSWSGETAELANIITFSRRFSVPLVALTSRSESALGRAADVVLELPKAREACPHGLAPTTSTTMQLALGDCLAIALLEAKGFTARDFKVFHPGGSLGASLKYVADVMHKGDRLPLVDIGEPMKDALLTMTSKSFGCLGVIDKKGRLAGIVTDGDLRRHMGPGLLTARIGDVMTKDPRTVTPDTLAAEAMELINDARITALFVLEKGKPVGIVHVHDLLRVGVA